MGAKRWLTRVPCHRYGSCLLTLTRESSILQGNTGTQADLMEAITVYYVLNVHGRFLMTALLEGVGS